MVNDPLDPAMAFELPNHIQRLPRGAVVPNGDARVVRQGLAKPRKRHSGISRAIVRNHENTDFHFTDRQAGLVAWPALIQALIGERPLDATVQTDRKST